LLQDEAARAALEELTAAARHAHEEVPRAFDGLRLHDALAAAWIPVGRANEFIERAKPWSLAKDPARRVELGTVLLAYKAPPGLDPAAVHQSISGGAAGSWALTTLAPRALSGDFAPGFYVKHIIKDMGIALDSAAEMHLDLPGLATAKKLYDQVAARGWEDNGTQALFKLFLQ
jgi:hypothetical protein